MYYSMLSILSRYIYVLFKIKKTLKVMNLVLTKSVKISEKTHKLLTELCPKDATYDEIIYESLLKEYDELSDEDAEYCNEMINKIENNDFTDVYWIDIDDLDNELDKLEK